MVNDIAIPLNKTKFCLMFPLLQKKDVTMGASQGNYTREI